MSDVVDRMVLHAWDAYERYKGLKSSDLNIDFNGFAVGFFLGAVVASSKLPQPPQEKES